MTLGPSSGLSPPSSEAILMSSERTEEFSSDDRRDVETAREHGSSDDATRHEATVVVRGETIRDQAPKSPRKEVSAAKIKMQSRLPVLDDDPDVGVQKEKIVIRDGKADLAFTGTLLASAVSPSAPKGQWQEYRIYETNAGKYVFSKVTRSVFAEQQDAHEAEIFDPSPSS